MFKWFSKLNIYQKLSAISIFVAILCFLVLIGVFAFRNSIDSEFGKPLVGLLDGKRQSIEGETNKTVEVVLDKTEAALEIGKTLQLVAKIEGAEGSNTIIWDSSDDKIAKVDEKGNVTPIAVGTATIRARMNDRKSAVCVVKISEAPKPPVVVAAPVVVPAPQPMPTTAYNCSFSNSELPEIIIKEQLWCLVNTERVKNGLNPLATDIILDSNAQVRLKELEINNSINRPNENTWVINLDVALTKLTASATARTIFFNWNSTADGNGNIHNKDYVFSSVALSIVSTDTAATVFAVQLFANK